MPERSISRPNPRRFRVGDRLPRRAVGVLPGSFALLALLALLHLAGPGGSPAVLSAQQPAQRSMASAVEGYPIQNEAVIRSCSACHQQDASGRMSRISFLRKTPEGWQASIRRMVSLHNVRLEPEAAREIVRYLSNEQGLAPEELRPGFFEVERRTIEWAYTGDRETELTCRGCHTMGRVITQRRTRDEWKLLSETHRALYPLIDTQAFRRQIGGGGTGGGAAGGGAQQFAIDRANDHLARTFPLTTPDWSAWSVNVRPARLEGTWTLSGYDPAKGPIHGQVVIRPVPGRADEFTTEATWFGLENGQPIRRSGRSTVYTGYQWRGRSTAAGQSELREVMFVERGWTEMSGRWYTGEHDEQGIDVTLRRVGREAVVTGVHPQSLRIGATNQEVRVYGANLPGRIGAGSIDFGPGVTVRQVVRSSADGVTLRVDVAGDARVGRRDLYLPGGVNLSDAIAVYDKVDAIRVLPRAGMARVGGAVMPKQFQQFEAVAYNFGPDGRADTADDLELGRVPVAWSIEEYPVTLEDDDVQFVGSIDQNGLFTPALDGPNPERSLERNNIGEVWVVATYTPPAGMAGARPLRARSHLLVAPPVFMRWDAWQVTR